MPKKRKLFLNVEYSGIKTRINATDFEDLSEVRRAIKEEYGPAMAAFGAAQLELYTNTDQLITDLDDISPKKTPQYYQKLTQEGTCVVIQTLPHSATESRTTAHLDTGSTLY